MPRKVIFFFGGTDRLSSGRAQTPPKKRHEAKPWPKTCYHLEGYHLGNLNTTRVSTTGRKAENGQDDSSSVGCSPGSFLGLAKAEVHDTDFPSPSQLSVTFAEVEAADSPRVGGVSLRCREQKSTGLPCISYSCCANVYPLGVFFVFVLPSSSYCAWRFLCLFTIDVILRFSGVT